MKGDTESTDDALGLTEASTDDLRQIASMITDGTLHGPLTLSTLSYWGLGHLSPLMVPFEGLGAQALLGVVRAVLAERRRAAGKSLELVWSGADAGPSYARYTKIVVPELIARARRRITIAGYSFDDGANVFERLHDAMLTNKLEVRLFVDIHQLGQRLEQQLRRNKHTRSRLDPLAQAKKEGPDAFAREVCSAFRDLHWPYSDVPLNLYFDPRTADSKSFVSLHAKCLIVDDEHVLITSANFTGRGQDRNIEVGVVIHDRGYATALERQWNNLVESRDVTPA